MGARGVGCCVGSDDGVVSEGVWRGKVGEERAGVG